jgi:hypothetical protein
VLTRVTQIPAKTNAESSPTAIEESTAYGLVGDREAELAAHVGHRVELVGQPEPNRKTKAPAGAPEGRSLPVLTVVSFRMLDSTCR